MPSKLLAAFPLLPEPIGRVSFLSEGDGLITKTIEIKKGDPSCACILLVPCNWN